MKTNNELLEMLKQEPKTIIAEIMPDEMKKEVLKIEMKRLNEIIPLINTGIEEAFKEEDAIVLISDTSSGKEINPRTKPSLTLRTESGQIIGEEILDKDELEELRESPDAYFISDNFVTYTNLSVTGEKQFFVVSKAEPSFISKQNLEDAVKSLTIGVPSTETDHYIKDCFDLSHDDKIGTIIVGFTPK